MAKYAPLEMLGTMAASLRGPRAKVERAKQHVRELEARAGELVFAHSTHPQVILREEDRQAGKEIYKVGEIPEIPDWVSLIAGDAVHNLRASLDLLLGQLIVRNNQKVGKEYFPISRNRKDFESRCQTEIEGRVGKDALQLIQATEAYRGGNGDTLWRLNRLDIEDKHHLLYTVGLRFASFTLRLGEFPDNPAAPEGFTEKANKMMAEMLDGLFWRPADDLLPLKQGDELFIDDLARSKSENEPKFRLEIAFSESEVAQGEPVLPTLLNYAQFTDATLDSFSSILPEE